MNLIRKLIAILISFILIVSLALWFFSRAINPEAVREFVNAELTSFTSQKSQVKGDITWQMFPKPGIRITHVHVGDEANNNNYSIQLDNLLFNLKITPLLRGKLVFSELKVDGFNIQINTDQKRSVKSTNMKASLEKHEENKTLSNKFAIERLLLSHGKITIVQDEHVLTLSGLQLGASQVNLSDTPLSFQLKAIVDYALAKKSVANARIQFKGSTRLPTKFSNAPLRALESSLLNGQLVIYNLHLDQFKINRLSANTVLKNGILRLAPLTFSLYQGESIGDLKFKIAEKNLQINQTANGINSSRLTQALFNKHLFSGKLDFSMHVQADLRKPDWQNIAMANGNISIKDGTINSINFNKFIEVTSNKINNLFTGKKLDSNPSLDSGFFASPEIFQGNTPFKLMTIQYRVENKILHSDTLFLQTDTLQLKGDAELNLNNYDINSNLLAKVIATDPKFSQIQTLLGGSFPLVIQGNLAKPVVIPDLKKINPLLTKLWLKETLTQPVKKVKDQLMSFFR